MTTDPTTSDDVPPITSDDDPDGDYWDRVYDEAFADGYAIGRYEAHLAEQGVITN